MIENVNEILEDLGLSAKEVKVYLALLELGEESASRVSEVAELNRVTTYTLLKSLQEKGFCSVFEKNNVQLFKPIEPEGIIGMLDEKKSKVSFIIEELKNRQKKIGEKSEVMLFEGKKGVLSGLNIILKDARKKKEVFAYGNFGVANRAIEYESLFWRKKRTEQNIKIIAVIDSIEGLKENLSKEKLEGYKKLTSVRYNKNLKNIVSYTLISENYVGTIYPSAELRGIVIKDKLEVERQKAIFEMLWNKSKK